MKDRTCNMGNQENKSGGMKDRQRKMVNERWTMEDGQRETLHRAEKWRDKTVKYSETYRPNKTMEINEKRRR